MHKISVAKKIKAPSEKVRDILWRIESWTQFWDPLYKVNILYDDGFHQDFSMFLEWGNQDSHIRTIRFLDRNGDIVFFSPIPPAPMTSHHGMWQVVTHGNYTELKATRWFSLSERTKETLGKGEQDLESFSKGFEKRLENLLECLGALCETSM